MASKISDTFDALIIGSHLAGLLHGLTLEKSGLKVGYIDSQESLGGLLRAHQGSEGVEFPRIPYSLSANETTLLALTELQNFIPELTWETAHVPVQALEGTRFSPFVGFGKDVPAAVDVWTELLSPEQISLNLTPLHLVRALDQLALGTRHLRSEITQWELSNGAVEALQINNRHWLTAERYYSCDTAQAVALSPLGTHMPARLRQKWSKAQLYTCISVLFQHGNPVENGGRFLFQGGGEDINPCLGEVWTNHSLWMSLIPFEQAEDYDNIYQELKKMKRLVKRAWPTLFSDGFKEAVMVHPHSHGWQPDAQGSQPVTFESLHNLSFLVPEMWVGSPLTQALHAGFSQILCAPGPTVLTHLDI